MRDSTVFGEREFYVDITAICYCNNKLGVGREWNSIRGKTEIDYSCVGLSNYAQKFV